MTIFSAPHSIFTPMTTPHNALCAREQVSALVDGQLESREFAPTLQACEDDVTLLAAWRDYHLIGDVLRSPALGAKGGDLAFLARMQVRLAAEPVMSGPGSTDAVLESSLVLPHDAPATARQPSAANEANFKWKLVAGFASMAAVAVIAFNSLAPAITSGEQLAGSVAPATVLAGVNGTSTPAPDPAASTQVLVRSPQGTMVRDARLEELLAAHKEFGGASALQMPSGFLRNATFEAPRAAPR